MKLKSAPQHSSNPTKALTEVKLFKNERRGFMTVIDSVWKMANK